MANILSRLKAFSSKSGRAFDAFVAALAFAFFGTGLPFVIFMFVLGMIPKSYDSYEEGLIISIVILWGLPLLFISLASFHWYVHRTRKMTFPQFWVEHPYLYKLINAAGMAMVLVLASIILMLGFQHYGLLSK